VGHFYSHKHPRATFVNHLVVSRILADEIRSLRNRDFRVIAAHGEHIQAIEDGAHLAEVLETGFGVSVDEAEALRLFAKTAG
jgi:N-hydroxyarylamine O-acetyltransferase